MLKEMMARCHLTFMQVPINFVRIVLMVDMLMHQMKLPFNVEDLLHVDTIVRPKKEPGTLFLKGNHYLCLRNPCQPQTRLVTDNPDKNLFIDEFISMINSNASLKSVKKAIQDVNKKALRIVADLVYELIYRHVILHKAEELIKDQAASPTHSRNGLRNMAPPARKGPKPSSTRTFSLPEFKVGKKASPKARRATFLSDSRIARRRKERKLLASSLKSSLGSGHLPCAPPLRIEERALKRDASSSERRRKERKAVSQLMLNRSRNRVIPAVEPVVPALPISFLSSNKEHSDDIVYAPPQLVGEVETTHFFGEAYNSDASSGEINMVRFSTLGQKRTTPTVVHPVVIAPPVSQVPLPTVNQILALTDAVGLVRAHRRPCFWTNVTRRSRAPRVAGRRRTIFVILFPFKILFFP
ncbi:hypothetical protein Acr_20g0000310 [Actinidia rufa]|uniref:Uncharacterized protein n=1 Tax=Actinidia rufa TaxID=165716 RepID=A0A7J0GBR5_9ERIC|nr:hypothetical protein Acr_20g0000310 [Actinidia rufa]